MKADVAYGMEDPAATGQVLAVLSVLPFCIMIRYLLCRILRQNVLYRRQLGYKGTDTGDSFIKGCNSNLEKSGCETLYKAILTESI